LLAVLVSINVIPEMPLPKEEETHAVPLLVSMFPVAPGEDNPVPPFPGTSVPATVRFPLEAVLGVNPVDPKDMAVTPLPAEGLLETHADPVLVNTFPFDPGLTNPVPPLEAERGETRTVEPVTIRFPMFAVLTLAVVAFTFPLVIVTLVKLAVVALIFVNVALPLVTMTLANVMLLSVLTEFPSWILVLPRVIGLAKLLSN